MVLVSFRVGSCRGRVEDSGSCVYGFGASGLRL